MLAQAMQVAPGGYAWWYFDGVSPDERRAFSAIFLVGSVFSPSYARRLRKGPVPAQEHVAVNLALYEDGRQIAWVMSEYGAGAVAGQGEGLEIAGSRIEPLEGGGLRLTLVERSAPLFASAARIGTPVIGQIDLHPLEAPADEVPLPTALGAIHRWRAVMPRARVEASFERPGWKMQGLGYHDVNRGTSRLEESFSRWSWARFHCPDRTLVLYSVAGVGGDRGTLVLDSTASASPVSVPELVEGPMGSVGWGLRLPGWFGPSGDGPRARPDVPIDVAPFYARYLATLSQDGRPLGRGLGEYLDLERFRRREIQFLLQFKTRKMRKMRKMRRSA